MKEQVFFEDIDNKKVFCVLAEPDPSQKKIVIISHGFRGTSTGPARTFVDFSRILNREGISTLRFDQPKSGNSEGDYLETSYSEWVDTIIYFANKYLDQDYKVILLGQSMGGAATMVAALRMGNKIPAIILWVPGTNDGDFSGDNDEVFEEGGQKYKGKFWLESKQADFFKCLDEYKGNIHMVYGEKDKYISQELRDRAIEKVKEKGQPYMILKGQDHSPWEYDECQKVYKEELKFIKKILSPQV